MIRLQKVVLIGGGAFAVEVASYISEINQESCSETQINLTDVVSGHPNRVSHISATIGQPVSEAREVMEVAEWTSKAAIIAIGDPLIRRKVALELSTANIELATIIHPRAHVSSSAIIGNGCIIAPFAFIGPYARLGEHVAINVSAIIGHDAMVGRASAISPGAKMNGHATCGEAAFLGAGAIIHPKVKLGAFSKLSAGSVLTRDAGDGHIMHGNPATGRQMIRLP